MVVKYINAFRKVGKKRGFIGLPKVPSSYPLSPHLEERVRLGGEKKKLLEAVIML